LSHQISTFSSNFRATCRELAPLISYPREITDRELMERLKELEILNVSSILPGGRVQIGKFNILGKGSVGLVVRVENKNNNKPCALKIRRSDANRSSMEREAKLQKAANSIGVGPTIIGYSGNFILMELIDGSSIGEWINHHGITRDQIRKVVINTLEQCYKLDRANIDHGELSHITRHVLVSENSNSHIIDFDTSSTHRKTSNVTAAAHSLLLSGLVSKRIIDMIQIANREKIIELLRVYKWNQTRTTFDKILQAID
jgi:putative serine/threonine protein kinase